MNHNFNMI